MMTLMIMIVGIATAAMRVNHNLFEVESTRDLRDQSTTQLSEADAIDETDTHVPAGSEGIWGLDVSHYAHGKVRIDLLKTSTAGRQPPALWTGGEVLGNDDGHSCSWGMVTGVTAGSKSIPMCLRTYPDVVSDGVKSGGRWTGCEYVEGLWNRLQDKGDVVLDIGANLGACSLPMLAREDVQSVVGFEPNPRTQFYLTSSILKNNFENKFRLYTVALGETSGSAQMFTQPGNVGNSVLGSPVQASPTPVATVPVETLDAILSAQADALKIRVMKIDAQGFEPKVLRGAQQLLQSGSVASIFLECAPQFLKAQGSSPTDLINLLYENKFTIYKSAGGATAGETPMEDQEVCAQYINSGRDTDIVFLYTGEARPPISCA